MRPKTFARQFLPSVRNRLEITQNLLGKRSVLVRPRYVSSHLPSTAVTNNNFKTGFFLGFLGGGLSFLTYMLLPGRKKANCENNCMRTPDDMDGNQIIVSNETSSLDTQINSRTLAIERSKELLYRIKVCSCKIHIKIERLF